MKWKDKLAQAQKLLDEVNAIVTNPATTADELEKIKPMMEDARRLRAEAVQLKDILEFGADLARDAEAKQGPDEDKGKREDNRQFKDWAEFLQVTHAACNPQNRAPRDPRLQYFKDETTPGEEKQMVESVGSSGGFLVPTEFMAQLQAVIGETAIVRNRATIIRMTRRAIQIPVLDQTGTAAGIPHWFGGMQFYWHEEAQTKTPTTAKFRQIGLVAHKLIGYTRASDELLDDAAISLSDFLSGPLGMAGGIAWMEDYAFLRGTGAGQPLGVITAVNSPTIVVARAAAGAIGVADVLNMLQSFLPSGRGLWIYAYNALAALMQLNGPAANPSYIFMPSARDGVPDNLFGMPAIRSEKVPALGVQGDIGLYDFRYYLVGDRQATTVESTQYDYWRLDQTSWRAVHRVDGQPWLSAPLTLADGISQISPFVILGGVAGS